jgi:recombinase
MNEWYAKDTSKKIKSVFQAKGRAGKHVASCPPYGYVKDENDHNQWLIDEEAAAVIRRIYKLTLDGLGPYQIACLLEAEKVEIPAVHQQKLGMGNHQCRTFEHPYHWSSSIIVTILERREYLGHTVNFKTRKHFKDTHSHYVDDDLWQVFEDTQEAIIDEETFDLVQKIRQRVTRWPNGWGPMHPLTGLVYCSDCGGKLYCHRYDNGAAKGKFSCGNYPAKKCRSGHRIDADNLVEIACCTLKAIRDYIEVEPEQFLKTVQDAVSSQQTQDVKGQKKRMAECEKRMEELEKPLCKIYEDNALGKLPDKRYEFLSKQYESEMSSLEQEVSVLKEAVDGFVDGSASAKKFMALIRKYQDFDNLTSSMDNELIEKIVVHERDREGSCQSSQRVDIYFSFIREFIPPAEPIDPEVAAAQEAERLAIEARKDRLHQNYLKRKANGSQRKYEERYKTIKIARKRERMAALPKNSMTIPEYYAMRAGTRTELGMPEGRIAR